jgi:hypothetical protein
VDIKHHYCNNLQCKDYGKLNNGNIAVRALYGVKKDKVLLYCRSCGIRFSSSRDIALFGAHLPSETLYQIIHLATKGHGVRATARILGLNKDTVNRVILRMVEYCDGLLSNMLRSLEMTELQPEVLWAFIEKKVLSPKKNLRKTLNKNKSGSE